MGNAAVANRLDPYGEYGHITPVPLEEAARLFREAHTVRDYEGVGTVEQRAAHRAKVEEATYRLHLSAFPQVI